MTLQTRTQSLLARGCAAALLLAAASNVLSPGVFAQSQVAILPGDESNDYFGFRSASLGDVNADGIPDFGVSGYRGSVTGRGRIKVYSGLDGSLIHHVLGPVSGSLGLVFAVGDINGDGHADFGGNHALGQSRGWIFSGLDGSALVDAPEAYLLGGAGDLDGDGFDDYVRTDGGLGNPAQVISGATGAALLALQRDDWLAGYVGDLNVDGVQDYATSVQVGSSNSIVRIRSGADTSILFEMAAPRGGLTSVVPLGDANQDGVQDFGIAFDSNESVDVISGADLAVLVSVRDLQFFTTTYDAFLSGVPDADGDGYDDFVVASEPPRLYSGRTGAILAQFVREDGGRRCFSVAGIPDANGDGRPEIVVGSPALFDPVSFGGTAALYSYEGPAGLNYCSANANSTGAPAQLTVSGSRSVDRNNLLLSVHSAPAGSLGIFLMGDGQQQTPVGSGILCVGSVGSGIARLPSAQIDANGHMLHEFDLNSVPGARGSVAAGSTRNFQAWFRDLSPAGPVSNLSDAVSVTFMP